MIDLLIAGIIGFFIGGFVGLLVAALMIVSGDK